MPIKPRIVSAEAPSLLVEPGDRPKRFSQRSFSVGRGRANADKPVGLLEQTHRKLLGRLKTRRRHF